MNNKIIIVGSTGKLGAKLLKFTYKNSIPIFAATCFKNSKKLLVQTQNYAIQKYFVLSSKKDQNKFLKILEKKIKIIYFLDYGSYSLFYLNHFLNFNKNSIIAIANKEMIIAGGAILQNKIKSTKNLLIPLDSEHFSLFNSNINRNIQKIFITASGGPFYSKKSIDLSLVPKKKVLSHPKWKMGTNNLIDSSNFVNKILEIYELSYIYNVPLSKIDFLISDEAYIHSIVHYDDGTLSLNCFNNDMLITLTKPLRYIYKIKNSFFNQNYVNMNNLKIEKPIDKRFVIFKNKKKLMQLSHADQIKFMIINNLAHKLYLSNKLNYNDIINFIMHELYKNLSNKKFKSVHDILRFITYNKKNYNSDA